MGHFGLLFTLISFYSPQIVFWTFSFWAKYLAYKHAWYFCLNTHENHDPSVYRRRRDIRQSTGSMVMAIVFSSFSQMEVAAYCILVLTAPADYVYTCTVACWLLSISAINVYKRFSVFFTKTRFVMFLHFQR